MYEDHGKMQCLLVFGYRLYFEYKGIFTNLSILNINEVFDDQSVGLVITRFVLRKSGVFRKKQAYKTLDVK